VSRILGDTGPLVALFDRHDADHDLCVAASRELRGPLLTTWAVVTEALYLLSSDIRAQEALLTKIESGHLDVAELGPADAARLRGLMAKYSDLPMDFADATLVHVAERDGIDTVFTLDDDFLVYRVGGRRRFTIIP
jgi:uncharacterized protein